MCVCVEGGDVSFIGRGKISFSLSKFQYHFLTEQSSMIYIFCITHNVMAYNGISVKSFLTVENIPLNWFSKHIFQSPVFPFLRLHYSVIRKNWADWKVQHLGLRCKHIGLHCKHIGLFSTHRCLNSKHLNLCSKRLSLCSEHKGLCSKHLGFSSKPLYLYSDVNIYLCSVNIC